MPVIGDMRDKPDIHPIPHMSPISDIGDKMGIMDEQLKEDIEDLWGEAAEVALFVPFAALRAAVLETDITYNQFESLMLALKGQLEQFRDNQVKWMETGFNA